MIRKKKVDLNTKLLKKVFFGDRKEGFTTILSSSVYTKEEIESGKWFDTKFIVENNIVYYFPYVTLSFIDGSKKHRTFNTYKEAVEFGNDMGRTIPLALLVDDEQYKVVFNNSK